MLACITKYPVKPLTFGLLLKCYAGNPHKRGKTADISSICIEHLKMHLFTALSRESYTSINSEMSMHVEADGEAGIQQALLSQRSQHQTQSDGSRSIHWMSKKCIIFAREKAETKAVMDTVCRYYAATTLGMGLVVYLWEKVLGLLCYVNGCLCRWFAEDFQPVFQQIVSKC